MSATPDVIIQWFMTQIRIHYADLSNPDRVDELEAIIAYFPTIAAQETPEGQRLWLARQLARVLLDSGALDRAYL